MKPEYENEQHEQCEEHGDVVHGPQHDDELASEVRQEADQLQDPEEAEGPEHRDAGAVGVEAVRNAVVDLKRAADNSLMIKFVKTGLYEVLQFLNEPCKISLFLGFVGPIRCQIWISPDLFTLCGHFESLLTPGTTQKLSWN